MAGPKVVRDLMSSQVVTLLQNDELSLADQVMTLGRIRHMPVTDGSGGVCGIVSQRDLFRSALIRALGHGSVAEDRALKRIRVKEVMTADVVTTTPDADVREAAKLMLERKLGCLPVVENGKLIGILTEADFVSAFGASEDE